MNAISRMPDNVRLSAETHEQLRAAREAEFCSVVLLAKDSISAAEAFYDTFGACVCFQGCSEGGYLHINSEIGTVSLYGAPADKYSRNELSYDLIYAASRIIRECVQVRDDTQFRQNMAFLVVGADRIADWSGVHCLEGCAE